VVEREPSKLGVAGSIPVSRFLTPLGARAVLARFRALRSSDTPRPRAGLGKAAPGFWGR
jgi:hypothetical protein